MCQTDPPGHPIVLWRRSVKNNSENGRRDNAEEAKTNPITKAMSFPAHFISTLISSSVIYG
jgi:hypothetical protein